MLSSVQGPTTALLRMYKSQPDSRYCNSVEPISPYVARTFVSLSHHSKDREVGFEILSCFRIGRS